MLLSLSFANKFWLGGLRSIGGLPSSPNYKLGDVIDSECDTV